MNKNHLGRDQVKSILKEKKRLIPLKSYLFFFIIFALTATVFLGAFHFYGASIIQTAYDGNSFGFLNAIISGQETYDAKYYVDLAQSYLNLFFLLTGLMSASVFLLDTLLFYFGWKILLFNLIVAFLIIEIIFLFALNHPAALNKIPLLSKPLRHYAIDFHRNVIQFQSSCAAYDQNLSYLLKPGSCTFENTEFKTLYRINNFGLRDDEDSLKAPEIIVLGDSFAMGWGVEGPETYASLLEAKTAMKVLNAGMSSFGTAREVKLLNSLDTSNVKHVILQYHDTDEKENRKYLKEGGQLNVMSQARYLEITEELKSRRKYYLGKITVETIRDIWQKTTARPATESPLVREVELFLNVLRGVKIRNEAAVNWIIFDIASYCEPKRDFISLVRQEIDSNEYPTHIERAKLLRISDFISPEDHCFILDDHLNAKGHQAVAEALYELIEEGEAS